MEINLFLLIKFKNISLLSDSRASKRQEYRQIGRISSAALLRRCLTLNLKSVTGKTRCTNARGFSAEQISLPGNY